MPRTQNVQRALGGEAIKTDALRVTGATAGQILRAIDDAQGGAEYTPKDFPLAPGGTLRRDLALVAGDRHAETQVGGPYIVVGGLRYDPAVWAFPPSTLTGVFRAVAEVSAAPGLTGQVQLWNLDDLVQVHQFSFAAVGFAEQSSAALALPAAAKILQVRIRLLGGVGPAHQLNLLSARLALTNTFT